MNKRAELKAMVDINKPDIIGITEVKPKNSRFKVEKCELEIEGYELFERLSEEGRGMALYVRQELKPSPIDTMSKFGEHVFVECKQNEKDILTIGLLYRSPSSTCENDKRLNELIMKAADMTYSHLLLLGDFNYPQINWRQERCTSGPTHPATSFFKTTQDAYLIQHQMEPTRCREGEKANTVDLIFTNRNDMINEITTTAGLGKSDHHTIIVNFTFEHEVPRQTTRHNFRKTNMEKLREELESPNWDEKLRGLDVEETWQLIKNEINGAIEISTPKTKVPNRRGKEWMDEKTLEVVRKKHRTFRKWQQTRSTLDYNEYIRCRNRARKACQQAKKNLEKSVAADSKKNPKAFWRYVKSKTSARTGIGDLKKQDGTKTSTEEEKANTLNDFFRSVFTVENPGPLPDPPEYEVREELTHIKIQQTSLKKILENLKPDKAPGPDGIPPRILAKSAEQIAYPISILYQRSLDSGTTPAEWKKANVTPIFKKGSRLSPNNYRPVSLTCILCKVMEKIVREEVMKHLQTNDLISKHQHGFVKGRSCNTQLLEAMDTWTELLDSGSSVDVIYMDFQKAFDSVPHRRLILKLEAHGIKQQVLQWITAFLSNRKQQVVLKDTHSQEADVTSGIPQGSVLGPALFVLYINDLPENITNKVKMFADDTKLYGKSDTAEDTNSIQEDLTKLQE
ncbi:ARSA (predicted) [Pycnogonum litorale]